MFEDFLSKVKKAAGQTVEGAASKIEKDTERAVDKAAKRWGKQAEKTAQQRAASIVARFLSPEPESDDAYYERTGTLREDDWG